MKKLLSEFCQYPSHGYLKNCPLNYKKILSKPLFEVLYQKTGDQKTLEILKAIDQIRNYTWISCVQW